MDLIDKEIIGLNFELNIAPRDIVKIVEILKKYGEETKLKLYREKTRDALGELRYSTGLNGFVKPTEAKEKIEILVGLFEEVIKSLEVTLPEERIVNLNQHFLKISEGEQLKNAKDNSLYYTRHFFERVIEIYIEMEKALEIEKKYPDLVRNIFFETPSEWYESNINVLGKRFPKRDDYESARVIVDIFEKKTSMNKIPHKQIKWRFV